MAMIAFEFDETSLRAAIGQTSNRQFRVTGTVSIELAGTDEEIGQQLREALSQQNVSRGEAIAVVSRWQTEMREVVVPPAPDDELPDLVRFQARAEFISLSDDWQLDYIPLDQPDGAPHRVLAAALNPEFQSRLKVICDAAGISLKHIVLRPLALIDLWKAQMGGGQPDNRLLINPYPNHADLSVTRGENLLSTRTIRFSADATPEKRASLMISETRRTLASARSQSKVTVDHVLIVGDAKRHKQLTGDLSQRLNLTVDFIDPFQLAPLAGNLNHPPNPSQYAGLLGSLVQQHHPEKHAIDFLSPRRVVVYKPDRRRQFLYAGLALAVALSAMLFCWWTLSSQGSEIKQLTASLAEVTQQNQGNGQRSGVDQIMGEVGAIDQWKLDDVNWLSELKVFSDRLLTPDDVIIDSLNASVGRDDTTIKLRSRVSDIGKETELLKSLSERPYVVIPNRSVEDTSDKEYPLSLDFNAVLNPDMTELLKRMNENAKLHLHQRNATQETVAQP